MNHFRRIWNRLLGRDTTHVDPAVEREIDDELAFHLEMRTRENVEAGMTPEEARRSAQARFGGVEEIRRRGRDIRAGRRVDGIRRIAADLVQDLRYALRNMTAAPGPTTVALIALALGIGASTAVFSVVDGVLLQALPYAEPHRIIEIHSYGLHRNNHALWEQQLESIDGLGFFTVNAHDLTGVAVPRRVSSMPVTEGFFRVLGVAATRGRTLVASDHAPDAPPAAVISDRLWRSALGADPEIVGEPITLDGRAFVIVGVMPAWFSFPRYEATDVWAPMAHMPYPGGFAIARLAEDATLERARIEVEALDRQLDADPLVPGVKPVEKLHDASTAGSRPGLVLLAGAVALVLAIACANVANLLLARSLVRRREIAVRAALGASRGRLVRQLLTESSLLAALGGALGVLLAWRALPALVALIPFYVPRTDNIGVDLRVLGFALAASLATGVLFGLAPAAFARHAQPGPGMAAGDGRAGDTSAARRTLNGLVVTEVALALVLVAGTGMLLRTFVTLQPSAPGFDARGKLTFELRPPQSRYADPAALAAFYQRTLDGLRSLPGAEDAAAITVLPFVRIAYVVDAVPEGLDPAAAELPRIWYERASANYFDLMGIPMLRGRSFAPAGDDDAVAVISQAAARVLWPGQDPLGRRLSVKIRSGDRDYIVVGIAGDTRSDGAHTEARATVWVPFQAHPHDRMTFVVQASGEPAALTPAIHELTAEIDAELPVHRVRTMEEILYDSVGPQRFYMTLMSAFGGIALVLAAVGFYGVMSYAVGRRGHELGIRLALGAAPGSLQRMVLREGLVSSSVGVAIGLLGALAFTRLLESRISDVQPLAMIDLVSTVALVIAVGIVATWVPARRATRVDPLITLREQ